MPRSIERLDQTDITLLGRYSFPSKEDKADKAKQTEYLGVLVKSDGSECLVTVDTHDVSYWTRFLSIFNLGPLYRQSTTPGLFLRLMPNFLHLNPTVVRDGSPVGTVNVKLTHLQDFFKSKFASADNAEVDIDPNSNVAEVRMKSIFESPLPRTFDERARITISGVAGKLMFKPKHTQFWKNLAGAPYDFRNRDIWYVEGATTAKHLKQMYLWDKRYKKYQPTGKIKEIQMKHIEVRTLDADGRTNPEGTVVGDSKLIVKEDDRPFWTQYRIKVEGFSIKES